ncbi:MAG: hypothetical protein LC105_11150 [Chitinophagales bacterium]|nr:hypothetical protein [Chitinophagales bacterium]MCZ2394406.1 hypothetical protein [Chitinophagales bacterium]
MKLYLSKPFSLLILIITIINCFSVAAQQKIDIVPIVKTDNTNFKWYSQELPIWGTIIHFPGEPEFNEKEIFSDKGMIPQKSFSWSDINESLNLEVYYNKLSEKLTTKNEKKQIDALSQKIALVYGGYPILSEGITNLQGIREYFLEIKTLKGALLKAKIFADGDWVMVASSLNNSNQAEIDQQAKYFLDNISFNPLPGEIKIEGEKTSNQILTSKWETLKVDNFRIEFPKYPVSQHKMLINNGQNQKYYEWHMGDGDSKVTYLLSVLPLENFSTKDTKKILEQSINSSIQTTQGQLILQRSINYFKYPLEEIIFKTNIQYFRVRYFFDSLNLYQILVSGKKEDIYSPNANRFLDGLKWQD